jgi:hypothetical protein
MMTKFWANSDWSFWTIDPDFDDDGLDLVSLRHEFDTHGALALHPNGNRRNGVDDPVPLHTHDHPGLSELERKRREAYGPPDPHIHTRPWRFELPPPCFPNAMDEVLYNMRLHESLPKGTGRVWRDMVMIHHDDFKNANLANHDIKWTEVWRGRGYIIYRRDLEALGGLRWMLSSA